MIAVNANPIPVFPEVPSMMVPPGCNNPAFSASSIIFTAMRSFTEFPGFVVSTFANTCAETSAVNLLMRTNGVFPMVSRMLLYTFMR